MAPLMLAATLLAPPSMPTLIHPAASTWQSLINEAAQRFALPADWITRVLQAESGGRTTLAGRPIRSRAGAIGLMQLMPETWAEVRAAQNLGSNPDDPHDNILAGAAYLRAMYDRFGYPGLFGAYNAGPARYAASLDARQPLPAETRAYLTKVTGTPIPSLRGAAAPIRATLFVVRHDPATSSQSATIPPAATTLFAVGGVAP